MFKAIKILGITTAVVCVATPAFAYETIKPVKPAYETIKPVKPAYETIKPVKPAYETIKPVSPA